MDRAATFLSSMDGLPQRFRYYTAKVGSEPVPLVVCLHGKGVNENAWFDFTKVKECADAWRPCVVASPDARGTGWYRGAAEQDVLDLVFHLQQQPDFRIDPKRIYLVGHSMGGFGTLRIATRNTGIFAACAPMAGFAIDREPMEPKPINAFVIHDADDDIVPVEESRRIVGWFARNGISHRYLETTGYKHSSTLISDMLPQIFHWFEQFELSGEPLAAPARPLKTGKSKAKLSDWEKALAGKNPTEMAGVIGKALVNSLPCDAALFHMEDFAPQPTPFTVDTLSNLYVHPYPGLHLVLISQDELNGLMNRITFSKPALFQRHVPDAPQTGRIKLALAESVAIRTKVDFLAGATLQEVIPHLGDYLTQGISAADLLE